MYLALDIDFKRKRKMKVEKKQESGALSEERPQHRVQQLTQLNIGIDDNFTAGLAKTCIMIHACSLDQDRQHPTRQKSSIQRPP